MKYILLMSGTKAGVEGYHAWSQRDIEAHMVVLRSINECADRIWRVCGYARLGRTG